MNGTFMIDDKFAPMMGAVMDAVKSAGGSTPRFVINSHFHGDHTGGNENLGKAGAASVAHENVRKRLAEGSTIKAFNMTTPPANKAALPVITFSTDTTLHLRADHSRLSRAECAHGR